MNNEEVLNTCVANTQPPTHIEKVNSTFKKAKKNRVTYRVNRSFVHFVDDDMGKPREHGIIYVRFKKKTPLVLCAVFLDAHEIFPF